MNNKTDYQGFLPMIIGLGLCVAWLLPYNSLPIQSFYRDWVVFVALSGALIVSSFVVGERCGTSIPRLLLLVVSGIIVSALLQIIVIDGAWGPSFFALAWAACFLAAYFVGGVIREDEKSLNSLLLYMLFGGVFSCLLAALQLTFSTGDGVFVLNRIGSSIYGNLGQRNHFADLLACSVIIVGVLSARKIFSLPTALALVAVMQFFSALSVARSAWLYALFMLVFGGIVRWREKEKGRSDASVLATVLIFGGVVFLLSVFLFRVTGVNDFFDLTSSIQRFSDDGGGNTLRLWLWKVALEATASSPLIGVGAGRFVGFSTAYSGSVPDAVVHGTDANAHNIFFHLAAEFGLPAALLAIGAFSVWYFRTLLKACSAIQYGALAAISVIGMHSLIEYPLWYAYFLVPLGLFARMAEKKSMRSEYSSAKAAKYMALSGWGALIVSLVVYASYRPLEQSMSHIVMRVAFNAAPELPDEVGEGLSALPKSSVFKGYGEAIVLLAAKPAEENASELSSRCDSALKYAPSPMLLSRCAVANLKANNLDRAKQLVQWQCKLHPESAYFLLQSFQVAKLSPIEMRLLEPACLNLQFN